MHEKNNFYLQSGQLRQLLKDAAINLIHWIITQISAKTDKHINNDNFNRSNPSDRSLNKHKVLLGALLKAASPTKQTLMSLETLYCWRLKYIWNQLPENVVNALYTQILFVLLQVV